MTTNETNGLYICVFTHHKDGGVHTDLFTNTEASQANACAKKQSIAHPASFVEVVAICDNGQNILATWRNGQRDGTRRWIAYAQAVAALALVTIPTFAHPVYPPDEYLAGCTIAHDDDGSRYAECPEDGAVLVYDASGQRFVNESGAPIHGAGWYVIE